MPVFSQNDTVYISGKVFSSKGQDVNLPVTHAMVHLKLSNGDMYEYETDHKGDYSFKVNSFPGTGELSVATDMNTSFLQQKTVAFLPSKEVEIRDFSTGKSYVLNLHIIHAFACFTLPTFHFVLNSANIYYKPDSLNYYNNQSPEESLNQLYDYLIAEPTAIIEIQGHGAFIEKQADSLSMIRADYIVGELIKKGIDPDRLCTNYFGSRRLLIKNDVIKKAKTPKEKLTLHQHNCRVVFRTINYEYNGPQTKKTKNNK